MVRTEDEVLQDPDGLNLRYYQIEAIQAAEKAIAEHKQTALLAMATGTGKTRTVLGMIYRFLDAGRFKRILYLVDRTSLGDQTMDTFKEVKLKELLTLNQMYDVKSLEDKEFEKDTRVHIATVQSLVKRIMYNESDKSLGVSDYDLVIVDEAHRGYILDKEMGDDEVLYRDQNDFRSKYRAVIDYFDAVKIALTATPALHTTEIFGKPVYSYDYRTAVIDGFLVDHDAPHIIKTKLSEEGISFEKGSTVPIYDPVTNEITNSSELEDDLKFEVEDFNRRVVDKSFNETVLQEIAKDIDPNEKGKTLIFAVDDAHADMITQILKDYYTNLGISEEAVMKITGSIENGNPVKIKEAIRRFKNETYPNIVVTVDLLTTGIDVEEIENLVFMRRIRSRILFEQMLGRATRLCPEIGKTHFEIYDAVGVYNALEPVSTMKPVVANPATTFDDLIDGIDSLDTDRARANQIDLIVAKMRRNKSQMSDEYRTQFEQLSGGMTPEEFIEKAHTDDLFSLTSEQQAFQKNEAFTGAELVHETHRLALMNAMLHDIDGKIYLCDTLSNQGKQMKGFDVVLTNPPFGTKKGGERANRDDFTFQTSNKQLNFLQHIYRSIKADGKARAAVVLPDNVLFADGEGERIREDLMNKCNLHTVLRLPTGIFYAQGVKTNVLFFTRGTSDKDNTKEVWFYDLRTNMPSFGKTNPLKAEHFDGFKAAYTAEDRKSVSDERWSCYTYEQISEEGKNHSLDLGLIKDDSMLDYDELPDPIESGEECIAQLEEAVDLLMSVVKELKSLEGAE